MHLNNCALFTPAAVHMDTLQNMYCQKMINDTCIRDKDCWGH